MAVAVPVMKLLLRCGGVPLLCGLPCTNEYSAAKAHWSTEKLIDTFDQIHNFKSWKKLNHSVKARSIMEARMEHATSE